jgi:hypothetical protein
MSAVSGRLLGASAFRTGAFRFVRWAGFDVLGRVSGFVALVISVIHPSVELWREIRRRPATEAFSTGSGLAMKYDPVEKTLAFDFAVVLRNEGTRDDLVSGASASLETRDGGKLETLPTPDLEISLDGARSVSPPFPVPVGSSRLELSVQSRLDDRAIALARAQGGRRLRLTLDAQSRHPLELTFCFDMADPGLFDSSQLEKRRFISLACRAEGDHS